ncbi:MAG: 50S ribosomal protein L3 N(5)-glutamine methyltransferase [Hahellaceae bacterium]|nr:50S ribosomal protein L3 N(5)-glutamine methyltransferase [Hahellaceae bacterium]
MSTPILSELHTIRDFIRYCWSSMNREDLYFGHGTDNAWDESVHLVLGLLHLPWDLDQRMLDARLVTTEKETLLAGLARRIGGREPLPYILGEAWFMGMPFEVSPAVLIPRSPIAELLEKGFQPWVDEIQPLRILDLCCGSGCIGIAAAMVFEEAEVVLADISPEALAIAQRNIHRYGLEDRVTVVQSDVYSGLEGTFDLILTNPPYVDADDMANLPPEYHHEPRLGLASGEDGLDCTRQILAGAAAHLSEGGLLVGEVGNSLPALLEAFPTLPFILPDMEQGGDGIFLIHATDLVDA